MGTKLIGLTLKSSSLQRSQEFYTKLGFLFERVQVSKATEIYRAHFAEFELSLIQDSKAGSESTPSLQLYFQVPHIDSIFAGFQALGDVNVLMEPTEMPEGRKAIVKDPDGHAIEILQLRA